MSKTASLPVASSTTTKSFSAPQKISSENVVARDHYFWAGVAPKAVSGAVDIDDLIDELAQDQVFASHLQVASRQIAEEFYAGETGLRALRLRAGLSQKELARRIGSQQPHIARIEAGITHPTLETIKKLAIGLDVDYLALCRAMMPQD